ncbi:MAG: gliding motility-associated ABC transporter substrate-binding protein GldG [Chitinophagales bacterium]|nr:gliding motility-associated ABC transporter substrate-binding protein GldG [Chitinophagales bacterium]
MAVSPINNVSRYVQILVVIAIVFVVNVISDFVYTDFDLTDDKRFTLSQSTKELIASADDNITIRVLLDGEFPAGFKRLQTSVKDMLSKFRSINSKIVFEFDDPNAGPAHVVERNRKQLIEDNIIPVNLSYSDGSQFVQKPVFPFAIMTYKGKKHIINLLEEQKPGDNEEEILNNSIALLEFKFANVFQMMLSQKMKNILITQGYGELDEAQLFRLESELRKFHKVGLVSLDSLIRLDSTIDLVIVPSPKKPYSLQNQFKLDQYIMDGGKVIWLIDKFETSLDSINKYQFYVPSENENGLDEMLFKYGVRVMPDLVMDLESSQIPQVIGMAGNQPQTRLFPWPYHLAVASNNNHPIVKNIDRVNLYFPSTIDTLKTNTDIKKTILLKSSKYSRAQLAPVRLTFEILKTAPDPSKFNAGHRPLAVLLEGPFESFFKNRLTPDFQAVLEQLNVTFKEESKPTKQLIVSDADFAKNLVNHASGITEDIGYNKWERRFYKGNKDFILNAVEYMLNGEQVLEARSKEIKLRLLDGVKTRSERTKWQLINVGLPIVLLLIFGIIYQFIRRKKYAS